MPSYKSPVRDLQFLVNEVFDVESLYATMPATEEVSAELVAAIVEEAGKLIEGVIAPINQQGDQTGCSWEDGVVTTPAGFKEAYRQYAAGGWPGLIGDVNYGGQGMPKLLSALVEEMMFGANSSFTLYNILSTGASLSLKLHGSEELKNIYLPKLYSGSWAGTMCLTEPHAGTDLGIISTKAVPTAEGSYQISGTKIFITAGEHDLTENIIHFVLAKLPDAPAGPAGISLFLVPKLKLDQANETTAEINNVRCDSIEHKMGIRASATCVLNFDKAEGFLVGNLNQGLACMFTMMNYERLSMGLQANGLAESSYQIASEYARERIQGRSPEGAAYPDKAADPIIVHPDVRRMLLEMRANIMAGRALTIYTASKLDVAQFHGDEKVRNEAQDLVTLLIPVAKAYCTDRGFDACVTGQQVLGGHGYIAEWGMEQNVRDARIGKIYEGANGIQALDLMGRKTVRSKGRLLAILNSEIAAILATLSDRPELSAALSAQRAAMELLNAATDEVINNAENAPNEIGAASYAYMELTGLVLYGYMWLRMMAKAVDKDAQENYATDYLDALYKTGSFFFARMMPTSRALAVEIEAGADTLMAMSAEQF